MQYFTLSALLGVAAATSEIDSAFLHYITKFNKSYNSMEEYGIRLLEFTKKQDFIMSHDAAETGYSVDHNKFSDWTEAEFKAILSDNLHKKGKQHHKSDHHKHHMQAEEIVYDNMPINWIDIGCVDQVQDQGQCGSCWAFSAVASMEAANCIAANHLLSFSEQQLVDCVTNCYGCNGGRSDYAFAYLEEHYAMTQSSYPYTGRVGKCNYSSNNNSGVLASSYSFVTYDNVDAMKTALNGHVLSVSIQSSSTEFQQYSGGVFTYTGCGNVSDHVPNIVGWGIDQTYGDYWIVRNSWGTGWGIQGYMKMQIVDGDGLCGINMYPNYVISN